MLQVTMRVLVIFLLTLLPLVLLDLPYVTQASLALLPSPPAHLPAHPVPAWPLSLSPMRLTKTLLPLKRSSYYGTGVWVMLASPTFNP